MDWTDVEARKVFEEDIVRWRRRRDGWNKCQTLGWVTGLFGVNFAIVTLLYGQLGYQLFF